MSVLSPMDNSVKRFIGIIAYLVLFPILASIPYIGAGLIAAGIHLFFYFPGIVHFVYMRKAKVAKDQEGFIKHRVAYNAYTVLIIFVMSLFVYIVFIGPADAMNGLVYFFYAPFCFIFWIFLYIFASSYAARSVRKHKADNSSGCIKE